MEVGSVGTLLVDGEGLDLSGCTCVCLCGYSVYLREVKTERDLCVDMKMRSCCPSHKGKNFSLIFSLLFLVLLLCSLHTLMPYLPHLSKDT